MEEIANWHVRRVQHDLFGFKTHVFLPNTELGYKAGPRLRELASAVRGRQEAGLTQPRTQLLADPCTLYKGVSVSQSVSSGRGVRL